MSAKQMVLLVCTMMVLVLGGFACSQLCGHAHPYKWQPWAVVDISAADLSPQRLGESFVLTDSRVTLQTLNGIPTNAESVFLVSCRWRADAGILDGILSRCGMSLRYLSMEGSNPSLRDMAKVKEFRQLETLMLPSVGVTAMELAAIGQVPTLREVNLDDAEVATLQLVQWLATNCIERCSLRGLHLQRHQIDPSRPWLARLKVIRFDVDDSIRPLDWLKHAKNVEDLEVSGVNEDDIVFISRLASLKVLRLPKCDITAKMLTEIWKMNAVERLDLSGTGIRDEDLKGFETMKGLKAINLNGCKVTFEGVSNLERIMKSKITK